MKLSKYMATFAAAVLIFGSCSDWLDVPPTDIISQDDLFEKSEGYRVALNGIYELASQEDLYGQELTWGLLSVCGNDYQFGSPGISYEHPYAEIAYYYNYESRYVLPVFESLWTSAYKVIMNCNNLIGDIRDEQPSAFYGGEAEKAMIMGEAIAMRALLHFELLRMFAPYKDDGKTYIPYYDQDGLSTGSPALTVNQTLEKVTGDLLEARELIAKWDLSDDTHRVMIGIDYRFKSEFPGSKSSSPDINHADFQQFYAFRGYRMNYAAVTALLARVYNWMGGDYLDDAAEMAEEVIGFSLAEEEDVPAFRFTSATAAANDYKTMNDLIFCLSDIDLYDDYEPYLVNDRDNDLFLTLLYGIEIPTESKSEWKPDDIFDDAADYRRRALMVADSRGYVTSLKYARATGNSSMSSINQDMLPVLRLSEMYYIKAEYEASQGLYTDAANSLDKVRQGRNCKIGNLRIGNQASFEEELRKEARREFIGEGQTYFYYKKTGQLFDEYYMDQEHFTFPIPPKENVNAKL